jgi:hypothetical protein
MAVRFPNTSSPSISEVCEWGELSYFRASDAFGFRVSFKTISLLFGFRGSGGFDIVQDDDVTSHIILFQVHRALSWQFGFPVSVELLGRVPWKLVRTLQM